MLLFLLILTFCRLYNNLTYVSNVHHFHLDFIQATFQPIQHLFWEVVSNNPRLYRGPSDVHRLLHLPLLQHITKYFVSPTLELLIA